MSKDKKQFEGTEDKSKLKNEKFWNFAKEWKLLAGKPIDDKFILKIVVAQLSPQNVFFVSFQVTRNYFKLQASFSPLVKTA
jgi:hypothetical protein